MTFRVTKTYGHDLGLSCAFRQWRADSHCRYLHGYALSFELVFEADELDGNGWVIDFGALKPVKEMLAKRFDHTLQIAADDPLLPLFHMIAHQGGCNLFIGPTVGTEAFAAQAFALVEGWLVESGQAPRVRLISITVSEHGANAATAFGDQHAIAAQRAV